MADGRQPRAARDAAAVHGLRDGRRGHQPLPDETVDVAFNPVGQVVGQLSRVEKSAAVIERWVQEYLDATGRLNAFNEAAEAV